MPDPPDISWPPRVGDMVKVKETGAVGEVTAIEGGNDGLQLMLDFYPRLADSIAMALDRASHIGRAHRPYRLDELEPDIDPG